MGFWTVPSQMGLQTDSLPPAWQRAELSRAEPSQAASALQAQMFGTTLRDKSLDTCYFIIQDDAAPPPVDRGAAPSDRPGISLYVLCPSRGPLHTWCNGHEGGEDGPH